MDTDRMTRSGFPNIYMYLISTVGKYTKQCLKAYKSLDAWSHFNGGLVSIFGNESRIPNQSQMSLGLQVNVAVFLIDR